ncbi:MAG: hypothetical protein SF339_00580 [Blastocatellia bacterium]|nr:hypothetical protein [Blastocatellia bacterium]
MAKHPIGKGRKNPPASSTSGAQATEETGLASESSASSSRSGAQRTKFLLAALGSLLVSLLVYGMRVDRVFGLIVDDAWYVMLAKALATGQGYTLINSPSPGITPFYSPGFPALLSLFYRLSPNFPNNIYLLKSVSIAAMMGVGALSYLYFKRFRDLPTYVSLGLGMATVVYPAIVFLATSAVMSEPVFMCAQLGAILLIERCVRDGEGGSSMKWIALGGVVAAFAFLTRPAGVGLLAAGVLYLARERMLKQAAIFVATVALLVGPWMLYSRSHAPTPAQQAEQGANIVQPYTTQLWQRTAGQPLSGTITAGDLPGRIWNNLSEIGRYDFGALVFYSLYRPLEPGLPIRVPSEARMISVALMLLALAGYILTVKRRLTAVELVVPFSIGVSCLWGWEQFRLLLPLVPFLFYYLLMGVQGIGQLYQKLQAESRAGRESIAALVFIWLIVLFNLYGNVQYIQKKNEPQPEYGLRWIRSFEENLDLINHISANIPKEDVIATQNPALVHLFTGHKTVASDDPAGSWETWNRIGVRYLARTSPLPLPKTDPAESRFRTVYRATGTLNLRLIDLGPPSSRPVWGRN